MGLKLSNEARQFYIGKDQYDSELRSITRLARSKADQIWVGVDNEDRFQAIAIVTFLLPTCQSVLAATVSGSNALALASVVVVQSPVLSTGDKLLIRRLFNGHYYQLRGDTKDRKSTRLNSSH